MFLEFDHSDPCRTRYNRVCLYIADEGDSLDNFNQIFCTPDNFVDTLRQVARSEWPQTLVFEDPAGEVQFGQIVRLQWEQSRIAQEWFE